MAEAVGSATESCVDGYKLAGEQLGCREVFSVVVLGPAELAGELPRFAHQAVWATLDDPELALKKALERLLGELLRDLAAKRELVHSPMRSSETSKARLASQTSTSVRRA